MDVLKANAYTPCRVAPYALPGQRAVGCVRALEVVAGGWCRPLHGVARQRVICREGARAGSAVGGAKRGWQCAVRAVAVVNGGGASRRVAAAEMRGGGWCVYAYAEVMFWQLYVHQRPYEARTPRVARATGTEGEVHEVPA